MHTPIYVNAWSPMQTRKHTGTTNLKFFPFNTFNGDPSTVTGCWTGC